MRRNETLKNGGEGIIATERVGERETAGACARWSYMPKHFSSLPSTLNVPFPSQSTLWIFGSPICVRLVVSFIRYPVVICVKHFCVIVE